MDVPFHLRKAYEREISNGILVLCDTPTDWNTKAFPVIQGNGVDVRLVGDFRGIKKLLWHKESPA